jgi:hypothetical protein
MLLFNKMTFFFCFKSQFGLNFLFVPLLKLCQTSKQLKIKLWAGSVAQVVEPARFASTKP